jgi:glucokinase
MRASYLAYRPYDYIGAARPGIFYVVSGEQMVIGVDLGGTKILAAVVDARGRIQSRAQLLTDAAEGADAVLARVGAAARQACQAAGLELGGIGGLCVAVPGPFEPETGVVQQAPNLGWQDQPVRAPLQAALGLPVWLENDVRAAVIAEHRQGAGRGRRHMLGVFVGTGIGGGLVFDDRVYRGSTYVAGEIGHVKIRADGPRCGCGQVGCLETFASRTAIARRIAEAAAAGEPTGLRDLVGDDLEAASGAQIGQAVASGDELATRIVEAAARDLAIGLGGAINLLNPELVVLGGGVVEGIGDRYLTLVDRALDDWTMPSARAAVGLARSRLGDDAGVVGAAEVAQARLRHPS